MGQPQFDEQRYSLHRVLQKVLEARQNGFSAERMQGFLAFARSTLLKADRARAKKDVRLGSTVNRQKADAYNMATLADNLAAMYEYFNRTGAIIQQMHVARSQLRIRLMYTGLALELMSGLSAKNLMLGVFTWSLPEPSTEEKEPLPGTEDLEEEETEEIGDDANIDGVLDKLRTGRTVSSLRASVPSLSRAYSVQDLITDLELFYLNVNCSGLSDAMILYSWESSINMLNHQHLVKDRRSLRTKRTDGKTSFFQYFITDKLNPVLDKEFTKTVILNKKKQPKEPEIPCSHNVRQSNLYGVADQLDLMAINYFWGEKATKQKTQVGLTAEDKKRQAKVLDDFLLVQKTLSTRLGPTNAYRFLRQFFGVLNDVMSGNTEIKQAMLDAYPDLIPAANLQEAGTTQ